MPLSDEERDSWVRQFRAEIEREDERRRAQSAEKAERKQHHVHEAEMRREAELAQLRLEVREQFWREQAYVPYTDSRGVEIWLTPEEHDKRKRARRRRVKKYEEVWSGSLKSRVTFAGVLALAVILGWILVGR